MININNSIRIENKNNVLVVSSRVVASVFKKRHSDLLVSLTKILFDSQNENIRSDIILNNYKSGTGKNYKEYLLTKKGLNLYLFNIQGYNDYKIAFLDKFEEMEQALKNNSNISTNTNTDTNTTIPNITTLPPKDSYGLYLYNLNTVIFSTSTLRYNYKNDIPYFLDYDIANIAFHKMIDTYYSLLHRDILK